jgi:hypothetical protein
MQLLNFIYYREKPTIRWFPSSGLETQSRSYIFPYNRNVWKRLEAELHGHLFPSWSLGNK